ncbi:hypothetical protein A3762_18005 [Oleiphilus sp. HI0125]|nr:hypothetical protein A3762_18005 [Oleiphilus sp. HI0125]
MLGVDPTNPPTLYRAKGCSECNHLGYQGRLGVYEIIEIDNQMRSLIHDRASEKELEACAREKSPAIFDDGARKILDGVTTVEEVLRVTHKG